MDTAHKALLAHLAAYKRESLGIEEDGDFTYRGQSRSYPHILPLGRSQENILPLYRDAFFGSEFACIKFHQFFHHLNSSQGLCINLFFPLIAEGQLSLLSSLLGIDSAGDPLPAFEKESELEKARTKTNFDFYLAYPDDTKIHVEVKYTERDFGKAPNDQEHRDKFTKTYLPLLDSRFIEPKCRDIDFFLRNYQLLRNIVHIGDKSRVVLLVPRFNSGICSQATTAMSAFLTEDGRSRMLILNLEDMAFYLETNSPSDKLREHYHQVRAKYLPSFG